MVASHDMRPLVEVAAHLHSVHVSDKRSCQLFCKRQRLAFGEHFIQHACCETQVDDATQTDACKHENE